VNDAKFRDLISGHRRGVASSLLRGGLSLLSVPYRAGVFLRNKSFDLGLRRVSRAEAPVISVGNVTAGGTGKTPFVAYLANWFRERGAKVVLLSRGYRALEGEVNDEKLVLDQQCPGVAHLQNPDRVRSAEAACRDHSAEVIILDDGFQHRRLHRDLNIVLIDALNPWGYGHLLPRGLMREPLSALRRADVVVMTRADQCSSDQRRHLVAELKNAGVRQWVEVAFAPTQFINGNAKTCDINTFESQTVAAFCGIGNPSGFRKTLKDVGYEPAFFEVFPDHHHYTTQDLETLTQHPIADSVQILLTTQKDLVKLQADDVRDIPIWAVEIGVRVLEGKDILDRRLQQIDSRRSSIEHLQDS